MLGYGRDPVHRIPVDADFRMDVATLREATQTLGDEAYVGAVVAVICTIEEGAVDPVHEVNACDSTTSATRSARGAGPRFGPSRTPCRPCCGHPVLAA